MQIETTFKNRETTEEFFERLRKSIENYTVEEWGDVTKESLQNDYEKYQQIYETLSSTEFLLIYYLRNSQSGDLHRFLRVAQRRFEATRALLDLEPQK